MFRTRIKTFAHSNVELGTRSTQLWCDEIGNLIQSKPKIILIYAKAEQRLIVNFTDI